MKEEKIIVDSKFETKIQLIHLLYVMIVFYISLCLVTLENIGKKKLYILLFCLCVLLNTTIFSKKI